MDIIIWIIIAILFILSIVGIIIPVLPGVALIWLGFIIYNFGIDPISGWYFWLSMLFITILSLIIDYISSTTVVAKWGGSIAGKWSAIIGILLGPIIMGPIGIILGPFVLVAIVEFISGLSIKESLTIGLASVVGFLGGSIVKAILYLIMIIVFLIKVL